MPHSPYPELQAAVQRLRALDAGAPIHQRLQLCREAAQGFAAEGAFGSAEAFLEQALPWARLLPAADAGVELLCELAEVAAASAEPHAGTPTPPAARRRQARGRALGYAAEAAVLAQRVACPAWEVSVLLRVSALLGRCGRGDEAVALQARAVKLMGAATEPGH